MSALTLRGVSVAYGAIQAVKDVDLTVGAGELVTLIGANGAGKSTLLKAITGLMPARGEMHFGNVCINGRASHQLVRDGIALVPEGRGIFGRMTVLENLQLGAYARTDAAVADDLTRVYELFPRLAERRAQKAGTMSGGEQQMLAIGRALMSRPKLLLLDEPSMGLAPLLVRKIFEIIRRIAHDGMTLLLVEQNARMALEVATRAYVMESGRITLTGPAHELANDPQVRRSYLGEITS
jgi:branched-chain amino acid transport system ATP-binding protein